MWNPYRTNYLPPEPSQTPTPPPTNPLQNSLPLPPLPFNAYSPYTDNSAPMYPPRQPQIPQMSPRTPVNHPYQQQEPFIFNRTENGPTIKEERRGSSTGEYPLPDPACLPPFLPAPRTPAPYLPPFSAVPTSLPPPATLPPFLPPPQFAPRIVEPPASHRPEPEVSTSRKRQRETTPYLPSLLSPFPTHPQTSYISPHPHQEQRQHHHQAESASPSDEDNRNKRQRVSVVTTTSVRTNRPPGYPPADVAATTTTTTTVSTSTTTTTSRSISTTTTTTTRGPPTMISAMMPFGSLFNSNGLPSAAIPGGNFLNGFVNRFRQDPRQYAMHHIQESSGEGGFRGAPDDDMRVAFDELRDFLSRSSSVLSPFIQFRMRNGHGAHDDDDDDDDDEEPEEVISFDQMNLPQMDFKEGVSQVNEKLCVICQDEYKDGEKLSTLPCVHNFHTDCIKKWVDECKPECPLCKAELA